MRPLLWALLLVVSTATLAEPRAETNEWSLNLVLVGSKRYLFEGGASARNDGGAGIGLSLTRNLNDYFAAGVEGTLAQFNYRATIAPGRGNAGASFDSHGEMESATLRAHATWNLLRGPVTPFLTAAAGVIFLDPNFATEPPANACWVYPWYGEVCGAAAPRTPLARLSYGAGAGLRFDLPDRLGFVRAFVGGEWIEIPEALSRVGYVQLRADFGVRF